MLSLMFAVILSTANMVYAAVIYLSLHGWLVAHEPSGMQLLLHLIITAPIVVITTAWLFYLKMAKNYSPNFWRLNLAGLFIPILSMQTGVIHFHYDKIGLVISVLVALGLSSLFFIALWRNARSEKGNYNRS
ncbi:hypothetical protein [Rheinheimera texasensis]|uniref:hypothetical protein n=1 Tax=Rheinheimera texasensis TaxID=306205 RepID=UPI0004E281FE|nr:hypothetical protein [Rheinheimera texasensis]